MDVLTLSGSGYVTTQMRLIGKNYANWRSRPLMTQPRKIWPAECQELYQFGTARARGERGWTESDEYRHRHCCDRRAAIGVTGNRRGTVPRRHWV